MIAYGFYAGFETEVCSTLELLHAKVACEIKKPGHWILAQLLEYNPVGKSPFNHGQKINQVTLLSFVLSCEQQWSSQWFADGVHLASNDNRSPCLVLLLQRRDQAYRLQVAQFALSSHCFKWQSRLLRVDRLRQASLLRADWHWK